MQTAMILIQLFLLLLLQFKSTESANTVIALPGCPETCEGSDISIPYPFGIGENCSMSEEFAVDCEFTINGTRSPYRGLFLVENISLPLGQARTLGSVASTCAGIKTTTNLSNNAPFRLNTEKNKFTVLGCNTLAYLHLDPSSDYSVGCFSSCDSQDTLNKHGSCSGIGCCQTDIPKGTSIFYATFDERFNNSKVQNFSPCSYAMVVEASEYQFSPYDITNEQLANRLMPIVLDWAIGNTTCENAQTNKSSYACRSDNSICLNSNSSSGGYFCNCLDGYGGKPYLDEGCQGLSLPLSPSNVLQLLSLYLFLFFYNICDGCHINSLWHIFMQILTNVSTKIHAPSKESVTIFKELIGAVVLSVCIKMMASKNATSTLQ